MKNKFNIINAFLGLVLLFSACTPTVNELGPLMDKSQLKFTITSDATNPNKVILKSLTPGLTPMWVTPTGNSVRVNDTLIVTFPGTYKFVYGVESGAGLVQADTFKLTLTTIDEVFVSDSLWTNLTGGIGNEKIWYLDINAAGTSKYFTSPKYFTGSEDTWDTYLLRATGQTDAQISAALGTTVANTWLWAPTWKDNTWIMPAADYGSMTFDLKGGPNVKVNHLTIPSLGIQTGKFMLDAKKHTLSLNNAAIIHNSGSEADSKGGWSNLKILTLSKDHMQLNAPGAGSYNFVTKTYYDSH